VLRSQRFPEQRIVHQVDLSDGKVIGRAPLGIETAQFLPIVDGRFPGSLGTVRHCLLAVQAAFIDNKSCVSSFLGHLPARA
jgi:hypothetical protein